MLDVSRKIIAQDLMLRFCESTENEQKKVASQSKVKRKPKKRVSKKKKDDFWDWVRFCKTGKNDVPAGWFDFTIFANQFVLRKYANGVRKDGLNH